MTQYKIVINIYVYMVLIKVSTDKNTVVWRYIVQEHWRLLKSERKTYVVVCN